MPNIFQQNAATYCAWNAVSVTLNHKLYIFTHNYFTTCSPHRQISTHWPTTKKYVPQIRQYHISYCENHTGVDEKKRERKRDDEMNKDLPIPSEWDCNIQSTVNNSCFNNGDMKTNFVLGQNRECLRAAYHFILLELSAVTKHGGRRRIGLLKDWDLCFDYTWESRLLPPVPGSIGHARSPNTPICFKDSTFRD